MFDQKLCLEKSRKYWQGFFVSFFPCALFRLTNKTFIGHNFGGSVIGRIPNKNAHIQIDERKTKAGLYEFS